MQAEKQKRSPVLNPIERVSEIIFGLIMALSFTGSLSVATAGRDEIHTMMVAALGCNLAWGLIDAVMYLVAILTDRARNLTLLRRIRGATTNHEAHTIIDDALPGRLGDIISGDGLEDIRRRLVAIPELPPKARLGWDDVVGSVGVFLLVVLTTFPVVLPFMLFDTTEPAMRTSNAVAVVTLFICGYMLGRYAGGSAWKSGIGMTVVGIVLVGATIALGG